MFSFKNSPTTVSLLVWGSPQQVLASRMDSPNRPGLLNRISSVATVVFYYGGFKHVGFVGILRWLMLIPCSFRFHLNSGSPS